MKIVNFISSRLSRLKYYLDIYIFDRMRSVKLPSLQSAEEILHNESPDPGTSAICKPHKISYEYDIQIVVPAYNVEAYVNRCIDSILAQETDYTYKIVIVNDGSTDDTLNRLKRYKDLPNVEIIDQKNRGFSGARNRAMEVIAGRYLMFVDSDDQLPPGAIQSLLDAAYEYDADIVQGGADFLVGDVLKSGFSFKDNRYASADVLNGYPWAKIYRSEMWECLQFPENYWFEDTVNAILVFSIAGSIVTISQSVYIYTDNPDGISNKAAMSNKSIDSLYVTRALLADAKTMRRFDKFTIKKLLDTYCAQVIISAKRARMRNEEVQKAVFVVFASLYKEYFTETALPDDRDKQLLLKSLEKGHYYVYRRICQI